MNTLAQFNSLNGKADLERSLVSLVEGGVVERNINQTLSDPVTFESCLRESSFHENSFIKVPLQLGLPSQFRVRLHFWEASVCKQNVHDHRFCFASMVLDGDVKNVIWRHSAIGELYKGYRYRNVNGERGLCAQESVRLSVLEAHCYQKSDTYYVEQDDLHTISHSQPAKTIILEDRSCLKPYANVYSKGPLSEGQAPHRTVQPEHLRTLLEEIVVQDVSSN